MKEIPLTKGYYATVDDEDYSRLNAFKWHVYQRGTTIYALRTIKAINGRTTEYMHRVILGVPVGMDTDHIDGNGLNNQKSNIRIVTTRENAQNRHQITVSKYPGVSFERSSLTSPWRAKIQVSGKIRHLGYFKTEEDAATAYRVACEILEVLT
jgi:primase-polymerase (primpol)-like protein